MAVQLYSRLALIGALCLFSFQCFALGLGNLELRSYFGEPLDAVIDVYGLNDRVLEETEATEFQIINRQFIAGAQNVSALNIKLTPTEDSTATANTLLQKTQSSLVVIEGQPQLVLSSEEICRDLDAR